MTIGTDLRRAREERGVSLREIADRTKIRVPVLRAIENDDFRSVPGGVILRGFLKLYAREVGLDPDDIARRCNELQAAETGAEGGDGPHAEQTARPRPGPTTAAPLVPTPFIMALAAAGVLVAAALLWMTIARPPSGSPASRNASAPGAPATVAASAPAPAPAPPAPQAPANSPSANDAGAAATSGQAAAGAGALRVEVRATAACWLSATADGQQVAYRVLNAGDRVSLSVKDEAVLRIGMPGNVAVSVNEAPVKPFLRPGTPTTLRITPANYRELLAP